MELFTRTFVLLTCLLSAFLVSPAIADVIDPFSTAQGPFSVGPGEEISEDDAVIMTSSVLGNFRVIGPVVDEEADPGSTATVQVSGGTFTCDLDFPAGTPFNNGGCVSGYDRGDGPSFDLTQSTGFNFNIQSVEGGLTLGVTVVDVDENLSLAAIENVGAGPVTIKFTDFLDFGFTTAADLSAVDNIAFTIINEPNQDGRLVLSEFSTDGPIGSGRGGPPSNGDDVVAEELPGNYYDPARDGEGCQLTLERDGITYILTCYFYNNGEQFWLIGVGVLIGKQIIFSDMTITSGTGYGDEFNADDVIRDSWGAVIVTWNDCNNAEFELLPVLAGFQAITLNLTRVVPITCGGGGAQGVNFPLMGAYFGPARDGEGFQLAVEGDGSIFVMTWYTYLNGEQIWLIGTGTRNGDQIVFDNMIITAGANFGPSFDPADVTRETFGSIILNLADCNNFTALVRPILPEFSNVDLDVTKIVPGACP